MNVASCYSCGKKKTSGNNVSHANNKTKKQIMPNSRGRDTGRDGSETRLCLHALSAERHGKKIV